MLCDLMFLYSGGSVHIWHDQWATSWSLPTRNVIPHTKLNSEYILSPELPQIKKKKSHTFRKYFIVGVCLAGRACGFVPWPGADFVGGDWWPALPSNLWNDKSSPTYHCGLHCSRLHHAKLHHAKLHHAKLHHASSVNHPRDSPQSTKVSCTKHQGELSLEGTKTSLQIMVQ